jgi:hypothetical protein
MKTKRETGSHETWRSQRKKGGDVMIYHRDYDTDAYFSLLPYLPTCPPHSHPHLFGLLLPIVCYSYSALKAVL